MNLSKVLEWIEKKYGTGKAHAVAEILQDKKWHELTEEEIKYNFNEECG